MEIHGDAPEIVEHWIGIARRATRRDRPSSGRWSRTSQSVKRRRRRAPAASRRRRRSAAVRRTSDGRLKPSSYAQTRRSGGLRRRFRRWSCTASRAQRDQQLDHRPRGIDLAGAEAELRAARIAVVVVVQPFAAGEQRQRRGCWSRCCRSSCSRRGGTGR